jgi:type III protein arginine methyltransferase
MSSVHRWEKDYEAVDLDRVPHKRLTLPVRVFEYAFDGVGKPRGRDNIMRLEVIAEGVLNAIVFWFDLHLDVDITITTGVLNDDITITTVCAER